MKIYIASSWANVHAIEMLTKLLRDAGHEVASFVEYGAQQYEIDQCGGLEYWISVGRGKEVFEQNIQRIKDAYILVYLGPSGIDTWAEVGYAYALGKNVYGITNTLKDKVGLNRRMIVWVDNFETLLEAMENIT